MAAISILPNNPKVGQVAKIKSLERKAHPIEALGKGLFKLLNNFFSYKTTGSCVNVLQLKLK